MAEYIDREVAFDAITDLAGKAPTRSAYEAIWKSARALRKIPAADVVPVVRCKDCEWFMREYGCPIEASGYHGEGRNLPVENDFCSYGERKD